jgi:hypothetical protein
MAVLIIEPDVGSYDMDGTTMKPALQLGLSFCASKTLLSAVELGVFTHLAQELQIVLS